MRRFARRMMWATFGTKLPPKYLALCGMNTAGRTRLDRFIGWVRRELSTS